MPAAVLRPVGWLALLMILALMAQGIYSPQGVLLDFANFYDAGQKARAGEFLTLYDPFALIRGAEPYGHMTFFSAPLTSYFYAPLAFFPPAQATILFKLLGALAEGIGLVLLYRHGRALAGPTDEDRGRFFGLYVGAALVFQPFWVFFAVGGQTSPFIFLLCVLAYLAHQQGQYVALAILFSVVVLIKPAFAPAAILLFFVSSWSFRWVALLCALAVGLVSVVLFGWDLHRAFLARVMEETRFASPPWMNSNPFSWLEPVFLPPEAYKSSTLLPPPVRHLLLGVRLLAAVALIVAMVRSRDRRIVQRASRFLIFSTAMALVLVVAPVVWSHYLVILFIPLTVLLAMRRHVSNLAWAGLVIGVIAALGQNLILLHWLVRVFGVDSSGSILALSVMKSLPVFLIVLVLILARRSLSRILHDPAWRGPGL